MTQFVLFCSHFLQSNEFQTLYTFNSDHSIQQKPFFCFLDGSGSTFRICLTISSKQTELLIFSFADVSKNGHCHSFAKFAPSCFLTCRCISRSHLFPHSTIANFFSGSSRALFILSLRILVCSNDSLDITE